MIAYCGGTFDLLHAGHIAMLSWAKREYGTVVVALNRDSFVQRYKGVWPALPFALRRELLLQLRCVDFVVENTGDEDSKPAIKVVRPNVIINGADWTAERLMKQMDLTHEFLNEYNLFIRLAPTQTHIKFHSSDLRKGI